MESRVKQQARAWLAEQALDVECSVCRVNAWVLGDLVELDVARSADFMAGAHYPVIPLICRNCGHTLFFNAVMMGLFDDEDQLDESGAWTNEETEVE